MSNDIKDPRVTAFAGDKVCVDKSVKQGRNGSYNAKLIKRKSGSYVLEVFMKIQFFFVGGDERSFAKASDAAWSDAEKTTFIETWHSEICKFWNNNAAGILSDKGALAVAFRFEIQEGGFMWDHFEITVTKIPATDFATSSVLNGTVKLDSNDLVPKPGGQLAVVHEFGHMIGLPDEYKSTSPHVADTRSIMHGGTRSRSRHFDHFVAWAEKNKC
jgi:hypothetical protein